MMTKLELKILKSESEYHAAFKEFERLIDADPTKGTTENDRLELLTHLIEIYEGEHFTLDLPDPIDAIEFALEQNNLTRKDLVPIIGSASKVSEVMSRKRQLSLPMIKALHNRFGLPYEVLMAGSNSAVDSASEVEWIKFPINEMVKRGWLNAGIKEVQKKPSEYLSVFLMKSAGLRNM